MPSSSRSGRAYTVRSDDWCRLPVSRHPLMTKDPFSDGSGDRGVSKSDYQQDVTLMAADLAAANSKYLSDLFAVAIGVHRRIRSLSERVSLRIGNQHWPSLKSHP